MAAIRFTARFIVINLLITVAVVAAGHAIFYFFG